MLIERDESVLLLVDFQERLLPAIQGGEACAGAAARLLAAARVLGIPVIATEQAPERIGGTVAMLAEDLSEDEIIIKTHFSAVREPGFLGRLKVEAPRERIVVCGTEAHVCVLQTALDLADEGYAVAMVSDAVGSRFPADREAALARARDRGLDVITAEMALFEWLGRADGPEFRDILPIIKDREA